MSTIGWNIPIHNTRRTHVVFRSKYPNVVCRHWKAGTWVAMAGGSSEEDGGRLSNLFKMYESEQKEENGSVYVGSTVNKEGKKKRHRSKSLYTKGVEENEKKHGEYFYRVSDGTWRPRVGVHGKGEPRWWALRVTIGREKQTCTAIERRYQQLREAASPEDAELMQEIETWDIWKRVRAWNPKNEKMGNKMIRYDGGGWVLVRAMMDDDVAKILRGNINILGFHHREVYNGEEFPIPVDDEMLASLTEWQEDLQPILEEQVREEMGLPPPIPEGQFFDLEDDFGKRKSRRDTKRQGLFSSNDADAGWGDDSNTWYSGSSSSFSDETDTSSSWLNVNDDAFLDQISRSNTLPGETFTTPTPTTQESSDELSAWLGDFNESLNDDWSRLDDDKEASSSPQSVPDTDDLSWWDDAPQEGSQDRNEIHAFTDEDVLLSTSDDDGSQGASVEVVRGEFKDFEGFILEDNPASDTIKAKIDVFGKPTVVHVRREDVEYL